MTVAIYARKSTDQGDLAAEQRSVARQVEHARAFAALKGWAVDDRHIYVDDGISGAVFAGRPGFMRLMGALKPRAPFDVLMMSEESRLGREAIETAYALKQLIQAGVRIWFYLDGRERTFDSPTDKLLMSVTAFSDELERANASQRTADALMRKSRQGHVTGGRVFGYRNVDVHKGTDKDGRPLRSHVVREIHEDEAAVVRDIFALCAKGYGKVAIAKQLNTEGRLAPRAQQGRPVAWAASSVRAILYRELYRGTIVYNTTKKRDTWGTVVRSARPSSEWVRVPVPDLRIVSDDVWEAAHSRLGQSRETYLRTQGGRLWGRPPSGLASKYLLTGLARCGVCGAGLEVRSRKSGRSRLFYYSCSSYYRRGEAVCPNRYEIAMDTADSAVVAALLEEVLTPEALSDLVQRVLTRMAAAQRAPENAHAVVERQLAECQGALSRLTAAVAAGGDVPSLVEAIKLQDGQRRTLERRLAALAAPAVTFDRALEQQLLAAVGEWRTALGRQVTIARQVLNKCPPQREDASVD